MFHTGYKGVNNMARIVMVPIKPMTAAGVIAKQESYRMKTIEEVGRLHGEGFEFAEISEEVGISVMEVRAILSEHFKSKSKRGRTLYRKFF
jgi:hypothetical protein